jgi:hypothetical protein
VTRAFNGTTALAHADAEQATQDPTAYQWERLKEALIAAQKYGGLVGTFANRPVSPVEGNVYIATDQDTIYVCTTDGSWETWNRPDHGDYANLSSDDHSQYHTEARKVTWHTALPGDHLTSPTTHNHSGAANMGNPIRKFSTGLDANKGTPSVAGQVYYGYDNNNLYFSPDGINWKRYTAMPTGTIMFFITSCPVGWSEVSSLDGKFLKGAATDEWTGLSSGGASIHTHTMPDVVNHTHNILAQTGITSTTSGSHGHSHDSRLGSGVDSRAFSYNDVGTQYIYTTGSGAHTHGVSIPSHDTTDYGDNPATSNSESSEPAHYTVRACRKD